MNVGGNMMVWRVSDEDGETPEAIDPQELPAFEFRSASLAESLASAAFDMSILAIFNLLFFAGAFVSFLRYDLR